MAAQNAQGEGRLGRLVFDELRAQIVEGKHPPGARLPMDGIKTEFGVSKQPVMEALRRLETIGLVEITPKSGCRVRRYGPLEARDFFAVFASFEGEIAAAAARRHSPEELANLEGALSLLHEVERASDVAQKGRAYFDRNAQFHSAIHTMSRSPLIADLSRRMWYLSDFLMYSYAGADAIASAVAERNHDHDLILVAIRGRNDVVAKAAMEQHIRSITTLFADDEVTYTDR